MTPFVGVVEAELTPGLAVGAGADGDGVYELVWVGKSSSRSTVIWP
jgi:hypothetical protein